MREHLSPELLWRTLSPSPAHSIPWACRVTQKSLEMCPVCLCRWFCGLFCAAAEIPVWVVCLPLRSGCRTPGRFFFGGKRFVTLTTFVLQTKTLTQTCLIGTPLSGGFCCGAVGTWISITSFGDVRLGEGWQDRRWGGLESCTIFAFRCEIPEVSPKETRSSLGCGFRNSSI